MKYPILKKGVMLALVVAALLLLLVLSWNVTLANPPDGVPPVRQTTAPGCATADAVTFGTGQAPLTPCPPPLP